MKSICLFNPPSPWLISDRALLPLGLLYLSSYLRERNVDVKLIDLSNEKYKTKYKIPKSDYYGITSVSPQYIYAKQILKRIKKIYPESKVMIGGVHATSLPNEVLEDGFDAVIRGEGELALDEIMKDGLTKKIYETRYINDLNTLPLPAWDLLDMESYIGNIDVMNYMKSGEEEEREINIMGTRGCFGVCAYCTMYKGPLRWRKIDNIIDEIQYLQKRYKVNRVSFCDDNIMVNKKWIGELSYKLKDTGIKWHCLTRADQADYKTCKLMFDSGCMGIDFGIESGSQKILDIIKKRTTVEKQEKGLRAAHRAGLKVRAQFMVGLPQETEEDHRLNLEFIIRNSNYVDKWGIHIFTPFPSCEIYHFPERFNYAVNKDTDFSNFQTIGKPGKWNFKPKENQEAIAKRRDEILDLIKEKNIYMEE